ncbi:T9SS type A sorting domain-containing protein [Adhaeribacter sp. BT258]|uniref:T9SS type A sorting domain-containing protein n=1 Tax=Adhaeribacter terrigena TaxID=2793070 RepID=A0ABS1BYL5_9BACT|nr:T9SS type A sorting domain-containing protein [Adhaeribacter terrigena]MBK0402236.1 T9SS type A sorting domain-containing protein [Adhaeribacter terrigena]
METRTVILAIVLTTIFTNLFRSVSAQSAPAVKWQKVYGGLYQDELQCVEPTLDGGFLLGGHSESDISGNKSENSRGGLDFWIVKVDSLGNVLWDKTYGGNRDDLLYVLKPTLDGGYIGGGWSGSDLSGDRTGSERGGYDMWVIKLDGNGNKVWDKVFGGASTDVLEKLLPTADGGFLLGGSSRSSVNGDKSQPSKGLNDFWLIKIDATGNKLWDKVIGGDNQDHLFSMSQTSDGGYILGGNSNSGISGDKNQKNQGENDVWIVKTDASGNVIWDKTFGGKLDEHLFAVQETPEGDFILGCNSRSPASGDKTEESRGNQDFWVIKTDAFGNKIWDRTFGGPEGESLLSLIVTSDGNYLLGGGSASGISSDKSAPAMGFYDYWVIKVDKAGNKIWDKTLGGSGGETINGLLQTANGSYILAGSSYTDLSPDKTVASKGGFDFWLIKLAPDGLTEKDFIIQLFPNPSGGNFNLKVTGIESVEARLTIFDFLGREQYRKSLQVKNKRISEKIQISTGKGIYLLQLKDGNRVQTRKLVVE